MTMVEVDTKLFIKCRLCLEDSGTYQIVPSVRDQISYCFEINVEPFDSLPQLVCKKCLLILSDYWKIKKSFIEKQDLLKKQTSVNNALPGTEQDERTPAVKYENSNELVTYGNKRRKTSSTSSHLENNRESNNTPPTNAKCKNQDWCKDYQKIFSCRMCNSQCITKKSALNHKGKHNILKGKHADIFKKYCVVKLQRIDNKPNMTGSIDQVVYSKSKIIAKGNSDYYVSYKYTKNNSNSDTGNESNENGENCISDESSDSSSRVNEFRERRRNRRRRICSRSSNETVVLENNSNTKSEETDCINIDDTDSDDDKRKEVKVNNKISNAKMHAVNKLITATYNKYLKRNEKPEKPSIDQQNRKIISIGRQIINKRGFNCTRLMKYMEHSNLNVIWLTRQPTNVTYNTNFYKIIPRYRYGTEKNVNEFEGYKKLCDKPIENRKEPHKITTIQGADLKKAKVKKTGSIIASDVVGTSQSTGCHLFSDTTLQPTITNGEYGSNITTDYNIAYYETKKLLNENPVANPRKLPKKFISETKKDKTKKENDKSAGSLPTLETDEGPELTASGSGYVHNIQMPIITFTTSLAPEASNEASTNNLGDITGCNSNNEEPRPVPKIKLRNVAELMSEKTLSLMQQLQSTKQTQQTKMPQNGAELASCGGNELHNTMPPNQNHQSISSSYSCDDYVILDTIDFPNTRTKSPFQYFRTLLQVHNLTLLETDSILTVDFNTLIKFKVLYKQETKEEPVILCLSLFCADKQFCLKIKDRNEININMSKISANWQWEILKIYRGDVVTKVLMNAQKISQEVYENTNSFLCLLKSINFVQNQLFC